MFCFLFTIFPSHDFGRTKELKLYIKLWSDFEIRIHYASIRGEGGTTLYKLYRYVPPRRVGFLRRFDLRTSIHFSHFGLESGMVFEGTTGVNERIYRFKFQMIKKGGGGGGEKEKLMRIRNGLEEFFVCALILKQ